MWPGGCFRACDFFLGCEAVISLRRVRIVRGVMGGRGRYSGIAGEAGEGVGSGSRGDVMVGN